MERQSTCRREGGRRKVGKVRAQGVPCVGVEEVSRAEVSRAVGGRPRGNAGLAGALEKFGMDQELLEDSKVSLGTGIPVVPAL